MGAPSRAPYIGGLMVTALGSGVTLFLLLAGLKEGFDRSDWPLLSGGVVTLLIAAFAWFRFARGVRRVLGLAIVALPLFMYVSIGIEMAHSAWLGPRLAARTAIRKLQVTFIEWPGFDGPAGLRLEMDLEHPVVPNGNLLAPRLIWSDHAFRPGDYFRLYDAPFLSPPVFQPYPYSTAFRDRSPSHLVYDLYPSRVRSLRTPMNPCIDPSIGKAAKSPAAGAATASWYFAGRHQLEADLGPTLTEALRAAHLTRERWDAMFQRFDQATLANAGYHACSGTPASAFELCFCR